MSDGEWPEDPLDPRCPACGEPVSATASYCMHCERDLPAGASGPTASRPAESRPAEATAGGETTVGAGGRERSAAPGAGAAGTRNPGMPTGGPPPGQTGWLHPDSAFDDVSTATVAIVGGVLDGFLLLLLGLWAAPRPVQSTVGLGVGVVGWLLATAWIARTRTVFGAVRKAAYSFALLAALAPPFVAYALRDPAGLVFGVVVWPVAAVVAGVGWGAGRGALDDGG